MNLGGDDRHVLPPLLTGSRRRWFSGLVLAGLGQAGAAATTVLVVRRGLAQGTRAAELSTLLVLAVVALGVGWTRSRERVLAERLGQDYAQQIRLRLVREALDGNRQASLGTTLTRASNDLTSVRNWVALGVSPIAAGIPMLLGCTLVLAAIRPLLALGMLAPLVVLGGLLLWGSRVAYVQSRRVRRERGRLAGHLADTLLATPAIRSAGGSDRELKRVEDRSTKMVRASVDRARVLGRIRGASAAATGLATATMIGVQHRCGPQRLEPRGRVDRGRAVVGAGAGHRSCGRVPTDIPRCPHGADARTDTPRACTRVAGGVGGDSEPDRDRRRRSGLVGG